MRGLQRVGIAMLLVLGLSLSAATTAGAASLSLAPGEYTIDTSTLELIGPGPTTIATGVNEGGIAVFAFDDINIPAGAEVFAEGSRPLELRSVGALTLAGLLEASGFDAANFTSGPNPGGPGGGAGAAGGFEAGAGPGGGGATSSGQGGGGGGGFGGKGASGGGAGSGSGGPLYGNLDAVLQGGSGGSGGTESALNEVGGGGGGGAVKLTATSLSIPASGELFAEGGHGAVGSLGASGGGSGGGIVLHAGQIDVAGGVVSADGGDGGAGGSFGDGGGGGAGRIAYQFLNLVNAGDASVAGGESGVSNNGMSFGHGILSPEVTGAPGVITRAQGPTATTSAATAIGLTGATLNGSVNPHSHATTYQFQLGTSPAYGATMPVPAGDIGSDSVDHAFSQAILGLAPATTYHYRIVATGFGFTVPGADMTFTTAPKCTGVKITPGRVKVKNGKAPIKLSSVGVCKGDLALFMKAPPKGKGHGKGKGSASKKGKGGKSILIGNASFSLSAGETKTIDVALLAAALKRLSLGKALPATAKATASDGLDPKVTTQTNVSLKLVKKGKGPKKGKGSKRP